MILFFILMISGWTMLWVDSMVHASVSLGYRRAALERVLRRRSMLNQTIAYACHLLARDQKLQEELHTGKSVLVPVYSSRGSPVSCAFRLSRMGPLAYRMDVLDDQGQLRARVSLAYPDGSLLSQGCRVHVELL